MDICFAYVTTEKHVWAFIRIVDVRETSIHDGAAHILRVARIVEYICLQREQFASTRHADFPTRLKRMTLPGQQHILITIEHDANRTLFFLCRDRSVHSKGHAPRFFAPKTAAHTLHTAIDAVTWYTQYGADKFLCFHGILRGRPDFDCAVFSRRN